MSSARTAAPSCSSAAARSCCRPARQPSSPVSRTTAGHQASGLLSGPSDWLFPGRWPGTALTPDALGGRLHAIGISPRQARSTALLTLAAEVPAAILAKTLGIHIQAAVQWQKISSGDWAAYAADVSRRATPQPVPSRHETPGRA